MIKLNCDLGEGMALDEHVMPYIDMANIACGFHASNPVLMVKTVELAKSQGVQIGAHPSYHDIENFGRREMTLPATDIKQLVVYQVGALQAICEAQNTQVDYVKPHGALYNTMMKEEPVFIAILQALSSLKQALPLMILANQSAEKYQALADQHNVPLILEAFADRVYTDEGNLLSRQEKGAVLEDDTAIAKQVESLINDNQVTTVSGKKIPITAESLCVHGDNVRALESVKTIRQVIDSLVLNSGNKIA